MSSKSKSAFPQLVNAVLGGSADEVRSLIAAGHDVNVRDRDRRTPLHHASIDGDAEIVRLLIDSGADLNAVDANLPTPLHFAVQHWARLLISSGALVDEGDHNGNTPLSNAVFGSCGRAELIEMLLAAGADRAKKNNYGVCPLDLAKTIANYKIPLEEK